MLFTRKIVVVRPDFTKEMSLLPLAGEQRFGSSESSAIPAVRLSEASKAVAFGISRREAVIVHFGFAAAHKGSTGSSRLPIRGATTSSWRVT
jgi:hypothetical protein